MTMLNTRVVPVFTLADRLRKARELTGLDQGEFAERADISRTTVVNYEMGHRAPRRLYLRAWADASGVDLGWLETGTAPSEDEAVTDLVRPEGLEPPTFWSVADSALAGALWVALTFRSIVSEAGR